MSGNNTTLAGKISAIWGVTGFAWLLVDAIIRLGILAVQGLREGLTGPQWLGLVGFVAFMAYSEGYRGFQRGFSPRTAARALYLYQHPSLVAGVLAPLYCMGYFSATRRPLLIAWVGTVLIVSLVLSLHFLPQPWRSIVDAGVVVGLSWGLTSFLLDVRRAFVTRRYPVDPEVPGYTASLDTLPAHSGA